MSDSDTDTPTETDHALITLRRLFNRDNQTVKARPNSPLGDYQIEVVDGSFSGDTKDALDSLGFEQESTHAHATEVDGETEAKMVIYLNDPRNEGGA